MKKNSTSLRPGWGGRNVHWEFPGSEIFLGSGGQGKACRDGRKMANTYWGRKVEGEKCEATTDLRMGEERKGKEKPVNSKSLGGNGRDRIEGQRTHKTRKKSARNNLEERLDFPVRTDTERGALGKGREGDGWSSRGKRQKMILINCKEEEKEGAATKVYLR